MQEIHFIRLWLPWFCRASVVDANEPVELEHHETENEKRTTKEKAKEKHKART